ncbi:hypothetical protein GLV94_07670 [Virgibacillus halodenitrificans]|uniref:Uncharacterized protein n=1 Tax=Virgibacillus halodenitrificans TaxID=1482 RepID=A0ABR7VNY7_VIRHA|nr:hypothetical protein [Virgibacillus halodenitrificans]MBD1223620.1 hypothetical protein [Virgibacillus halodenitrificans]MYL45521.1 hypothetical protein [Virgibacillus halodenitrificans]MYL56666.1 hypothetical protein [Virgibacillus halodenitrificans]
MNDFKNINLIKLAAIYSVFAILFFFVLFYLLEGTITYSPITLSIVSVIVLMTYGIVAENKKKKR